MWYSIWQQGTAETAGREAWEWAGKSYQLGEPAPLPEYMLWGKDVGGVDRRDSEVRGGAGGSRGSVVVGVITS
jgi:hypothetical protein